jgi:hypothetical protein
VGTRRKTQLLGRVDGLLAELRQLRAENRQLRASHAKAVKTIEQMAAANDRLAATIEEQNRTIASLEAHLRSARGLAADAPTVPSAQVPVYLKPPSRAGRRRRPGGKAGHEGCGRRRPETIDQTVTHTLKRCPHCDRRVRPVVGRDQRPRMRVRYVVDIVPGVPEATEHRIGQYWCSSCDRSVEPAVVAALPGSQLGIRATVQSAILHYRFGIPTSKVIEILRSEHAFTVTKGGLHQAWQRLADFLSEDYEELVGEIRKSGALHADETGWRVNGDTHWLWCFATKLATVYRVLSASVPEGLRSRPLRCPCGNGPAGDQRCAMRWMAAVVQGSWRSGGNLPRGGGRTAGGVGDFRRRSGGRPFGWRGRPIPAPSLGRCG